MADPLDALILDLLESIAPHPKPYFEVISVWRTSCPRLPVWEEATARGYIERRSNDGEALVCVTSAGRDFLRQHRGIEAMDPELAAFLESRAIDFRQELVWRGGLHRFELRGYFTADPPPDAFVLAGRALVIEDGRVLVVQDGDGEHVIPGGRREPGETAVDAVHRELIEETGWSISNPIAFCAIHLHYETPEPVNVGRIIYPDFLWHIFIAEPSGFDPAARHTDGYELGATFRPIAEVLERPLEPFQRVLLEAAVRARDASAPRG